MNARLGSVHEVNERMSFGKRVLMERFSEISVTPPYGVL
jgi:hypothetical protein